MFVIKSSGQSEGGGTEDVTLKKLWYFLKIYELKPWYPYETISL
jgi:hypothetical protein